MTRTYREHGASVTIIREEAPQQCDLCGRIDELRPYGPLGEMVCFDCGMKDEMATRRAFAAAILAAPETKP